MYVLHDAQNKDSKEPEYISHLGILLCLLKDELAGLTERRNFGGFRGLLGIVDLMLSGKGKKVRTMYNPCTLNRSSQKGDISC